MKSIRIILLVAIFAFPCLAQNIQQKPNILFLFADDQRADTIAAYGNKYIKTPNIDRLVSSGFSFMNNYIFGGNSGAVCLPSRAMLMSGKVWFRVDNNLNNARMLPEILQEHGYTTFGCGKWHNGEKSFLRAFKFGKAIMFGGMADHTKVPVKDIGADGTLTKTRIGEKFSSELFADTAIEFLKNCDKSKPFFAYVAFTAPHDPRNPPLTYRKMYYKHLPPLPPNFQPQISFTNGFINVRDEHLAPWPRTEQVIRDQLAEYFGLITHLDEQIGRILDTLKKLGLDKNTIIIYAADNGLAIGSHGLLGKQNVYEHSMKVPLIFSGPNIPRGKSTQTFTYLFDIFPTLCDLIEIKPPDDLDGYSLRPIWEDKKESVRDSVFLPFLQIQRAIRDERWKLISYPKIQYMELFDLKNDPYERTNLIFNADVEVNKNRLLNIMKQWQEKYGDKVIIPEKVIKPEKPDFSKVKRVPDQWQPDWIIKKYFK